MSKRCGCNGGYNSGNRNGMDREVTSRNNPGREGTFKGRIYYEVEAKYYGPYFEEDERQPRDCGCNGSHNHGHHGGCGCGCSCGCSCGCGCR